MVIDVRVQRDDGSIDGHMQSTELRNEVIRTQSTLDKINSNEKQPIGESARQILAKGAQPIRNSLPPRGNTKVESTNPLSGLLQDVNVAL